VRDFRATADYCETFFQAAEASAKPSDWIAYALKSSLKLEDLL
jgi:hypothetical protein